MSKEFLIILFLAAVLFPSSARGNLVADNNLVTKFEGDEREHGEVRLDARAEKTSDGKVELKLAGDDMIHKLYVDGDSYGVPHKSSLKTLGSVKIPANSRMIAIECLNIHGQGGLLAFATDGSLRTDASWKCTASDQPVTWMLPNFDDRKWHKAVVSNNSTKFKEHIPSDAKWIWTKDHLGRARRVYCRGRFRISDYADINRQLQKLDSRYQQLAKLSSERRLPNINCVIKAQSYSAHTVHKKEISTRGFLQLNGGTVWQAGWVYPGLHNHRGVNTMLIDPYTCKVTQFRRFDTLLNSVYATMLVEYLTYLHEGAILVGITGDEPASHLGPARRPLDMAGVYVWDVKYRGNFVFILQKGFPQKSHFIRSINPHGRLTNLLKVKVTGKSVPAVRFTRF